MLQCDPPIHTLQNPFDALYQRSQYCTRCCIGLVSGMIYFGYRSIPIYRFGFTAIFYIYKQIYIYIYVCVCVCVCVCVYYNKYKSLP